MHTAVLPGRRACGRMCPARGLGGIRGGDDQLGGWPARWGPGGGVGGKLTGEGLAHGVTQGRATTTLAVNWVFSAQVKADRATQEGLPVSVCASAPNALQQAGGGRCGGQWVTRGSKQQQSVQQHGPGPPGDRGLLGPETPCWVPRSPPISKQKWEPAGGSVSA